MNANEKTFKPELTEQEMIYLIHALNTEIIAESKIAGTEAYVEHIKALRNKIRDTK